MTTPAKERHETTPIDSSWHQPRHQTVTATEMLPGAVSESNADPPANLVECSTVGCGARFHRSERRYGPRGIYCKRCHEVVRALYDGGEVLVAVLAALHDLDDDLGFVEPYPDALCCLACSSARAAVPGTLWCSSSCRRRLMSFGHRSLPLVNLGGVVLPERTWRVLRGLGGGTYRTRRLRLGVIGALVAPLDTGRSRSARAGVAARRGLPPPEDGLALRDLVRSMTPKVITLK